MPHLHHWHARRRCHDEHGSGGVQFLITIVAVLFLFTSLVQYGIRMHANRMAEAAAREAAVTAARFDGTTEAGHATANDYLSSTGAIAITGSVVNVTSSATEVRVSVTVTIVPLAPWLADPITSVATAPRERFVP